MVVPVQAGPQRIPRICLGDAADGGSSLLDGNIGKRIGLGKWKR